MDFWKNTHTRLWLWYPDAPGPQPVTDAWLESVNITHPLVCKIVLGGRMPVSWYLAKVPGGTALEVLYRPCYDPAIYRPEDVIMRFKDLRVKNINLPKVVAATSDETGLICLYVTCHCSPEVRA